MSKDTTNSADYKFSLFKGGILNTTPEPEPITLPVLFRLVRGDSFKTITNSLRSEQDPDKKAKIKRSMSYATFGGVFSSRANDKIISRSGLIVIDLDHLFNPDATRDEIINSDIWPAFMFVSPSANGLKVVYAIDPQAGSHKDYYFAIENYYKKAFELPIDAACKDISRACFLCCDPDVVYYEKPAILDTEFLKKYAPPPPQKALNPAFSAGKTSNDIFEICRKATERNTPFVNGSRHSFVFELAGRLHSDGTMSEHETLGCLTQYESDGFPGSEIQGIVKSVFANHALSGAKPIIDKPLPPPQRQDKAVAPAPLIGAFDPLAALNKYRIDTQAEIMEPPVLISMKGAPVSTLGNFSLLIGKAKSRKTFLIGCMASAAISGSCSIEGITGTVRGEILYFDSEQSPCHAQRTVKRICKQSGIDIQAYGLRPLEPKQRWEIIEYAIQNTPGLALVIIDGIVDLLSCGVNDEPEAIKLTSALLRWTLEYNIHIITVLHQNKGDFNARGHIGTSLVNKAESVLSVTKDAKDESVSVVKVEYSRDIDFQPFAFTISDEGLPILCDQVDATQSRKSTQIAENFAFILPGMRSMGYSDLCNEYMEISALKIDSAKQHIAKGVKLGILKKDSSGIYRMNSNNSNEDDPF
jgi:hypothetical protein